MSASGFLFECPSARAYMVDNHICWEIAETHPVTNAPIWISEDAPRIYFISGLLDHDDLAAHRTSAVVGTRQVWVVKLSPHLKPPYQLVAERSAVQHPGGIFWAWRLYYRSPFAMPGAEYLYERAYDNDPWDHWDHAAAILHVLTHDPDWPAPGGGT